jgi:hypothetical protein
LENGLIIKCQEKENLNGQMGGNIKDTIKMIKKKDMESLNGQMEENIKAIGFMENNMERVNFIIQKRKFGKREIGMMVQEYSG